MSTDVKTTHMSTERECTDQGQRFFFFVFVFSPSSVNAPLLLPTPILSAWLFIYFFFLSEADVVK